MFKSTILITSVIFLTALNADNSEGGILFNEAKCMQCHEYSSFSYKKEKINSFKRLHKQVKMCESGNNIGWFEEEVLEVTKYLNREFYHFKQNSK